MLHQCNQCIGIVAASLEKKDFLKLTDTTSKIVKLIDTASGGRPHGRCVRQESEFCWTYLPKKIKKEIHNNEN